MLDIIKKLRKILNKKQKNRVVILGIMIVIGGLLETLSVSMILPLMNAITEENAFTDNQLIVFLCGILNIKSLRSFVLIMLIALACMFVLKNVYMLLLYYVQHSFITNNQYRTSRDLLEIYLNKPYSFFLTANKIGRASCRERV